MSVTFTCVLFGHENYKKTLHKISYLHAMFYSPFLLRII